MSKWFPLHCHSTFSLLDGLSKADKIAERLLECGYEGSALTDHSVLAGVPPFVKALTKKKLKAITGNEFYLCQHNASIKDETNRSLSHLCVLAKGQQGWVNLIKASSESNRKENFYRKPRLSLEQLAEFAKGEFIVFSGHMGSDLANICFAEPKLAYNCTTYEDARKLVRPDWKEAVTGLVKKYQNLFGEANFYLEIQLIDHVNLPASLVVARILRHMGKLLGVPRVATADSHYPRKEDAIDQRVLLCIAMETTLNEVKRKFEAQEEVGLSTFFKSNNYHIPSIEEMVELHKDCPDELENSLVIASRCETPKISNPPRLPVFQCPDGYSPDEYLKKLCDDGWKKKILPKIPAEKLPVYTSRLNEELAVLLEAKLSSYFLIVQDFIRYASEVLKALVGKGRGSAAGCLVSYLTNITRLDPIRYGLLFSRFYNHGRNTKDRVALPDIDTDLPIGIRDLVVDYLRQKYGADKVCQMATYSRMQGRGALKDVLRVHEKCTFEEMNRITEHIPDESEIADQLQEMFEETGEASIIRWALENNADQLKEWCWINDQGELEGTYSTYFAQAIRLEGTKRSQGKHASGVIISSEPLNDIVPMVYDKSSDQMMVGVDMRDAEDMGLVKFDLLALRTLNCLMDATHVIRYGKLPVHSI